VPNSDVVTSSIMTNRKSFPGLYQRAIDEVRTLPLKSSICTLIPVSGFIPIRHVARPSVNSCIVKVHYRNENFDP